MRLLLLGALNFLLDLIRRLQKDICDIFELSEKPIAPMLQFKPGTDF